MSRDLNFTEDPCCLSSIMRRLAFYWATQHAITKPGDIVLTTWGGWKTPRKVRVHCIRVEVVARFGLEGVYYRYHPEFQLIYSAQRLRKNGGVYEQDESGGIELTNLETLSGRKWERGPGTFNHAALTWEYARG